MLCLSVGFWLVVLHVFAAITRVVAGAAAAASAAAELTGRRMTLMAVEAEAGSVDGVVGRRCMGDSGISVRMVVMGAILIDLTCCNYNHEVVKAGIYSTVVMCKILVYDCHVSLKRNVLVS